jgi:uncharacterized integral membrane protein
MTESPVNGDSYKAAFSGKADSDTKVASALAVALDVRKFEIDLYWKRASYFWVFTGAALAGHLAALSDKDPNRGPQAMLLTSCVGFVFAFAWYLVNRASKFWQSNWEAHVDLLEDEVNGPLYKTVLSDQTPWWEFHGAYQFSVSKINQILSFYVVLVFVLLVVNTVQSNYAFSCHPQFFPTMCLLLTGVAGVVLVALGRTNERDRSVSRRRRRTAILNDDVGDG